MCTWHLCKEWCRGRTEEPHAAKDARVVDVLPGEADTSLSDARWPSVADDCGAGDGARAGYAIGEVCLAAAAVRARQARRRRSRGDRASGSTACNAGALFRIQVRSADASLGRASRRGLASNIPGK